MGKPNAPVFPNRHKGNNFDDLGITRHVWQFPVEMVGLRVLGTSLPTTLDLDRMLRGHIKSDTAVKAIMVNAKLKELSARQGSFPSRSRLALGGRACRGSGRLSPS